MANSSIVDIYKEVQIEDPEYGQDKANNEADGHDTRPHLCH